MTDFTHKWISEASKLEQSATAGPWVWDTDLSSLLAGWAGEFTVIRDEWQRLRLFFPDLAVSEPDAAFIALTRTHFPRALAALKAVLEATEGKTEHHGHSPLNGDDCAACLAADIRDAVEDALRDE